MDPKLLADAGKLIQSAPCSVELPAGTGKTHILSAVVSVASRRSQRVLVLTHTNAGVDAIRKRLTKFAASKEGYRVETLTSWAFSLVRAYPKLAGVTVTEAPDWTNSNDYLLGAVNVVRSKAVRRVLEVSFDYLCVDEYQDCTWQLHQFVIALSESIPKTIVFGDKLQAIFGFKDPLVNWNDHVVPIFPSYSIAPFPHRWREHNFSLGQWTLGIRKSLVSGARFDASATGVPGVSFEHFQNGHALRKIQWRNRTSDETTLVLGGFPQDDANNAATLGGNFQVLENVQGTFILGWLNRLPGPTSHLLAAWLAQFAKKSAVGLARLDKPILDKLKGDQDVAHLKRKEFPEIVLGLNELRGSPSYEKLVETARLFEKNKSIRIYRREAWRDAIRTIGECLENPNRTPQENLALIRNRLRYGNRSIPKRVVSRTLLVKGLEFDHVVISSLQQMTEPKNFYVAVSRARKSITIIGSSPIITLKD